MPAENDEILEQEMIHLSPEPVDDDELGIVQAMIDDRDMVQAASIGRYDNIGDAMKPDEVGDYLDGIGFSRDVWMTVLHNSATPASSDRGHNTVVGFHNYHVRVRKWKAIGYHFVISTDGTIRAARKMAWMGAHAGASGNPGSIGVCLVGNFETTDKPTDAQKKSFARLHTELDKYYYGGEGSRVRFHREFMSTECPGRITVAEVMNWVDNYGQPTSSNTPLITLDGEELGHGIIVEGSTYAPLRIVFEAAGFDVKWNGEPYYRVLLTSPNNDTERTDHWDSPCGGTMEKPLIVLDEEALGRGVLHKSSTYAPLRSVFEAAGFGVKWHGAPDYEVEIQAP